MQIYQAKIDDLIPYEKNTKKHNLKQIANVANSIKRFGFQQPIVIDKNNVVIIGHCRLLAAKKLGRQTVPVTCAEDLTPEEVDALRIVDNKTNESLWDTENLIEEQQDLTFEGFDFDFLETEDPTAPEIPQEDPLFSRIVFKLHNDQMAALRKAIFLVKPDISETFGNQNADGNAIYEVVRQWAAQKT